MKIQIAVIRTDREVRRIRRFKRRMAELTRDSLKVLFTVLLITPVIALILCGMSIDSSPYWDFLVKVMVASILVGGVSAGVLSFI